MSSTLHLSGEITRLARDAGFDLAGVAGVADVPEHQFFCEWIARGAAGEMNYLEARTATGQLKRASLANAAAWARSVVVCAINYNTDQPYSTHAGKTSQGWISRYAWSQRDYHEIVLGKLRRLERRLLELCREREIAPPRTWCYVDTGPIVERIYAKYAGIGSIAKNTCILNEDLGSWLFLGVMLTSLELAPGIPAPDRCGSCTRCLDACPTNAFPAPYELDATKCISYLTIEKRGSIPEELREFIGRQVFGCDICQDVCPWNAKALRDVPITFDLEMEPRAELVNPALAALAAMDEAAFEAAFNGSPVRRAGFNGLRRNVAIVMGNSGLAGFASRLEDWSQEADEGLRSAARWALGRLRGTNSGKEIS